MSTFVGVSDSKENGKVQTLSAGHALAKHLVGGEDIRHYVEIRA